jgi:hypothetical protein
MAREIFFCLTDIGPLGKTIPPPFIILRNGMKLWKIKCNYSRSSLQIVILSRAPKLPWRSLLTFKNNDGANILSALIVMFLF